MGKNLNQMKKLLAWAPIILAVLLLSSCSAQFYQSSNRNQSETQVVLNQKNFRVVGEAEGVAKSTFVFMIGGLSKKSMRSNAVAEMFKNAHLTGSQTIININVKESMAGFPPFYLRRIYTATGTIVEFTE